MSSPARPTAIQVRDQFTKLYYSLMKDKPHQLHEVYKDSSMIGRPDNEGKMCHYTLSDVGENLNMLTSGGYDSVTVSSVSQDSIKGSVVVKVNGYFVLNEKRLQRKFVQSFFLAPQEDGYFVMNDMFIFHNEKIPEAERSLRIRDTDTSGEKSQECSAIQLKNLPLNHTIEFIDNACKEFGTIKRRGTEIRVCYFGYVEFKEADAAQRAIEASPVTICGEKVCVGKNQSADKECSAIHLINVPPNDIIESIDNACKEFGTIKRRGTEVRVCYYGYVEFEEPDAAQRAIEASPVTICGEKVCVEKRRSADKGYGVYKRIHEGKRRQDDQNIYRRDQVRGGARVLDRRGGTMVVFREKHQEEERRLGDFWEWQRSMAMQSKFREETGETGVDHSWDYDVIMEEYRKFMEEAQRKIQEEEHQN